MDVALQMYYDSFRAQWDYYFPISRHYKKIKCLLCINYHARHCIRVLFIFTSIRRDRYHSYPHFIRDQDEADRVSCPGHSRRTESQISLCFKSSISVFWSSLPLALPSSKLCHFSPVINIQVIVIETIYYGVRQMRVQNPDVAT